jgi:carbamoyltransferase
MNILGISAFYHDSAACLVRDGKIIAAVQEERFTRKKYDSSFPKNAASYCLKAGGITVNDLDIVVFYDKPFLKFERILYTYLSYAPKGIVSFLKAMPVWLKQKIWIKDLIAEELDFKKEILFTTHHQSHAASAFFASPFNEAAFLTMDGVGEWATAAYGIGIGNKIITKAELNFPCSLGLLYSAFTYYCGFKVNSGEYKLMGLAPYGEPKYKKLILDNLIDLKDDGSFQMNMEYFDYCVGMRMTNGRFNKLFEGRPRMPEAKLTRYYMDIASSIQEVTQEIMVKMANHVHRETGMDNLCLAGGVALNCVGNGNILRSGSFKNTWIQPAAGDAGGALGAALSVWYQYLGNQRYADGVSDAMQGGYLGPSFNAGEIETFLKSQNIPFLFVADEEIPDKIARLINDKKVIGWFQGRMEFGPRALGARSILGDPRDPEMQKTMNLKIKFRESFRPFAPSVLSDKAEEWFEMNGDSPYMLITTQVKTEARTIPAVTHVDGSARVHTVDGKYNPLFYALLKRFDELFNCAVIINTSFNVRGEPIVCTPFDAYQCFMRTNIDHLLVGNYLLDKNEQTPLCKDDGWRKEFTLD